MTYDQWKTKAPRDRWDQDEDERGEGECTCRRTGRGVGDPEAGWRVDRWCPIHGLDIDAERERIRDENWR
jgi:hypothetical protein